MGASQHDCRLTERDAEILLALDRCPLTPLQLLTLSTTFRTQAFHSARRMRDRLHGLRDAGYVQRFRYAVGNRFGTPGYYKLTRLGYEILHGKDIPSPTKGAFREIAVARHQHTLRLAEFFVHTAVCARRRGASMDRVEPENRLRLQVGEQSLFPDCAFELRTPTDQTFTFYVELDNGTERIRSTKETDSWQQKIRFYEEFQDARLPDRFRVVVLVAGSRERARHILALAAELARNPKRSLVYCARLADYLGDPDPLVHPCFRDHHGAAVPLVPRFTGRPTTPHSEALDMALPGLPISVPAGN